LLAFAQAPFLHVHDEGGAHEHARGFAHAHWPGQRSGGLAPDSGDDADHGRALNWTAGDGRFPVKMAAEAPAPVSIPEPAAHSTRVAELVPRAYDPPWRACLQPRAPPA
jgi:hypothetical protein